MKPNNEPIPKTKEALECDIDQLFEESDLAIQALFERFIEDHLKIWEQ